MRRLFKPEKFSEDDSQGQVFSPRTKQPRSVEGSNLRGKLSTKKVAHSRYEETGNPRNSVFPYARGRSTYLIDLAAGS